MKVSLKVALNEYEDFKNNCINSLPNGLTNEEQKNITEKLLYQLKLVEGHLKAIYKNKFELGKICLV